MDFEILGKSYPMGYTIWAQRELSAKFGSLKGVAEAFASAEDDAQLFDRAGFIGATMMMAEYMRRKSESELLGVEFDGVMPPTYEQLISVMNFEDAGRLTSCIYKTMTDGNEVTTEVKEDRKNAGATRSK